MVSFSPQSGGTPRSHPSFQRQETAKPREIANPALVQQWDWWRERTPELTLCNAFNPIKFVRYCVRGWMTLRAAASQGKLRPMMPLERCLLRLTLLLLVAYIVTATSGILDGGVILELDLGTTSERKFALKFIASSLFGWIFVFSIPLGMIEQPEPRFLSPLLPVALLTFTWAVIFPLEQVGPLTSVAAGGYAAAVWITCIGGWFAAYITVHACAMRVRLSEKLPAYVRQLLPKMLLLLAYLLLSSVTCWFGNESKRAGLALAQTMVLDWAVFGGLTVMTLFERKLEWANALRLDLTPLECCVPVLYTAWAGLTTQLYEAPEDLLSLLPPAVAKISAIFLWFFMLSTSEFVGGQRKQWVRVRIAEGEEHMHKQGLMAFEDAKSCMDPETPATSQYAVHYGSIFNWRGAKGAKRGEELVAKEHVRTMDAGSDALIRDLMGHGMGQVMEHQGGDTSEEGVVRQQLQHARAQQWLKTPGKGSQPANPTTDPHGTGDGGVAASTSTVGEPPQEDEESCAMLAPSQDVAISYDDLLARLTDVEAQLQLRKAAGENATSRSMWSCT
jgi:hypothetical protein